MPLRALASRLRIGLPRPLARHFTCSTPPKSRRAAFGNDADSSGGVNIQDRNNLHSEYGTGGSDAPQRFVIGASYELPIGRGKLVGNNWGRGLDTILGGWQTNGLLTFQSGLPLAFSYVN